MAAFTAALLLLPAARAQADFTFNEPSVRATGAEQIVFDYSTSACEEIDSDQISFRMPFGAIRNGIGIVPTPRRTLMNQFRASSKGSSLRRCHAR